jgi:hypothetical protein
VAKTATGPAVEKTSELIFCQLFEGRREEGEGGGREREEGKGKGRRRERRRRRREEEEGVTGKKASKTKGRRTGLSFSSLGAV